MQARAARLMGVSKARVHAVIQEALQAFGAEQTLRQALGHALNKRGLSIESVLNLQGSEFHSKQV
jgi:predicted XRE-type DNA-binding protein